MRYLSIAKRRFTSKFDLMPIVSAILYKFKTECQWEQLLVSHFFEDEILSYETVFHHYRQW